MKNKNALPWRIAEGNCVENSQGRRVAVVLGEHVALVAAAPELLEALQIMLPMAESHAKNFGADPAKDADFIAAQKAIEKATCA